MLTLHRLPGESVVLPAAEHEPKGIEIKVLKVEGQRVWLGIDAPRDRVILRKELCIEGQMEGTNGRSRS